MKTCDRTPLDAAIVLIALASVGLVAQGVQSTPPGPLPDLLSRVASYLDGYEARFSAVISQEDYQQGSTRSEGRGDMPCGSMNCTCDRGVHA